MKFTDRKEFTYDEQLFGSRTDLKTALAIHHEYVKMASPKPYPLFYEVDRRSEKVDALWHVSLDDRTVFSRVIDGLPVILKAERPDWRLTRVGITPQQKYTIWMSNLGLAAVNWFPMRGDVMYFNGYRNMIISVTLEPQSYWQQTNAWLGLTCSTIIPADGDARPLINPGSPPPAERIQTNQQAEA